MPDYLFTKKDILLPVIPSEFKDFGEVRNSLFDFQRSINELLDSGRKIAGIGTGNVLGPLTHTANYVPQWSAVADNQTLVEGFGISSNGESLVGAVDYAAMRTLLDLEAGTDFYSKSAEDIWRNSVTQTEMGYLDGITAVGGQLIDDANVAAQRTTLELGADITGFTTINAILAAANAAIDLNSQNLTNVGAIGCDTITLVNNYDIVLGGTGHVTSGSEGFIVGTLTITDGSIDDTDGSIAFGATNFTGVGTIGCGAITTTDDFKLSATKKLYLDGGTHTYIDELSADIMRFVVGGYESLRSTKNEMVVNEGSIDLDFRVESNNFENAFFVDGEQGNITVGYNTSGVRTKWVAPGIGTLSAAATAASDGDCLMLMAGTYTETAATTITSKSLSIIGMGPRISIIACTGCDGIVATTNSTTRHITLKDFSVTTSDAGGYKAVKVIADYSASNVYRTFYTSNLDIYPVNDAVDYWDIGIYLQHVWNSKLIDCNIVGGVGRSSESAVRLTDKCVDVDIVNLNVVGTDKGIHIEHVNAYASNGGRCEGIRIDNYTAVAPNYGVYWVEDATYEGNLFQIINSHIAAYRGCIYMHNVNGVTITGSDLPKAGASSDNFISIYVYAKPYAQIMNNLIGGVGTGGTEDGIVLEGVTQSTISGNIISGQRYDIWLKSTSDRNLVIDNQGINTQTTHIRDDGDANIKREMTVAAAANQCQLTGQNDGGFIYKITNTDVDNGYGLQIIAGDSVSEYILALNKRDTTLVAQVMADGLFATLGGVHVGALSDPGADNLVVDGTSTLTGNVTNTALAGVGSRAVVVDANGLLSAP